MVLYESGEMYLESIYVLNQEIRNVRSIDVSSYLGYSKPSVSRAVGVLKKEGFVNVDEEGFLTLTPAGKEIATKIYNRHILLTAFLTQIGVDPDVAAADACKMEHAISDETYGAIQMHLDSLK